MYFDYLAERNGFEHVELPHGFIVYEISGEDCFIHDLYVKPEWRSSYLGTTLADKVQKIAKQKGCKRIWGNVVISTNGANVALMAHLKWGLKLHSTKGDCIITVKEL